MRAEIQLALLATAALVLADGGMEKTRSRLAFGNRTPASNSLGFSPFPPPSNVFSSAGCRTGYELCEDGCIPIGATCCYDGSDTYCRKGYYCTATGCCPDGEICRPGSGGDATCDVGLVECGNKCMPLDGTCCDGDSYCPNFGTCLSDDTCCPLGETCDGDDDSDDDNDSTFTSARSSPTATTTTDDFPTTTSTTSRTTTTAFTSEPTTTTIDDDDDVDFFPTTTADDLVTTTTSESAVDTTSVNDDDVSATFNEVTITVTPTETASAFPDIPGAAGRFTAEANLAAGVIAAAALLL